MTFLSNLLDLVTLAPDHLIASLAFLGAVMAANDTLRTSLMIEFTRSAFVHVIINVMTLLPAGLLAVVLLVAAYRFPQRGWVNLAFAVLLYAAWYFGGAVTRLARRDSEGADPGFMFVGALITFPVGILAAVVF